MSDIATKITNKYIKVTSDSGFVVVGKCYDVVKIASEKIISFVLDIIFITDNNEILEEIIEEQDLGKNRIGFDFDPNQPPEGIQIEFLEKETHPEYFI